MKLILTQPEIEAILRAHVNLTVSLSSGSDYTIDFTATRSDSGITATIDIPYMGVSSIPEIASAKPPAEVSIPDGPVTRGPGRPRKNPVSVVTLPLFNSAEKNEPEPGEETEQEVEANEPEAAAETPAAAEEAQTAETPAVPAKRGPSLFGNG